MSPATPPIASFVAADYAQLREVVVGPVLPISRWKLVFDGKIDLASLHQLRHNLESGIPAFERAVEQHRAFVEQLRSAGVTVHTVDRVDSVMIQVYPRDIAVVIDDTCYLTRPRLAARRREQHGLRSLLPSLARVRSLAAGTIEGGDIAVDELDVLVGLGEETDRLGIDALRRALAEAGSNRSVVPIEFAHRGVVHLDTKFTIVAPGVALFVPSAFTPASRVDLERRYDLIEATLEEARLLHVNTMVLGLNQVMINADAERLQRELEDRHIAAVPVLFDEITKFPGGLRCATLPLVRR